MTLQLTLIFTIVSGICAFALITSCLNFICRIKQTKNPVAPLIKKCAFISLFGYTLFVLISFALYLLQLLWYISPSLIQYNTIICQLETFNIVFFMTGKLSMYLFFMSLVHITFRDSSFAYSPKILLAITIIFFCLMAIIGGFYMTFLYFDFENTKYISSPSDCQNIETSVFTTITIWTGASCDATWSLTCLLLFYLRLRKLSKLMKSVSRIEKREMIEMEKISNDTSAETSGNTTNNSSTAEPNMFMLQKSDHTMDALNEMKQLSSKRETLPNNGSNTVQSSGENIKIDVNANNRDDTVATSSEGEKYTQNQSKSIELSLSKKLRTSLKFKLSIEKKKKSNVVHKFLPIMLKLSILSGWCAFSTFGLGFIVWRIYPTMSSVIDSTINAFCVYLSFRFTEKFYSILCLPFISCRNCRNYRIVIREANEMSNEQIVLG